MATPEVQPAESLLRQIGPSGNPIYFDPDRRPPVDKSLFLPGPSDADGLSVVRSNYRSHVWAAFRLESPQIRFRLAVLRADRLAELARHVGFDILNIDSTPDEHDVRNGEPWAHCVLREINRTDYDRDTATKRRIKEWALAVSEQVGHESIIGPFPEPSADSPYRQE